MRWVTNSEFRASQILAGREGSGLKYNQLAVQYNH